MIRQCPRCDLRFRSEAELGEHLATDHDADPETFARLRYPGAHDEAPLYDDLDVPPPPTRRYLVVANQTLEADALTDAIAERLAAGPAELLVVVPATHSDDYTGAGPAVSPATDDRGSAQARWRLRRSIEALRARGVTATGEIGPPDPYEAAGRALERQRVDEVILGTLPPASSRWFHLDVPTRIRRSFDVPVTVVSAEAPAATPAAPAAADGPTAG